MRWPPAGCRQVERTRSFQLILLLYFCFLPWRLILINLLNLGLGSLGLGLSSSPNHIQSGGCACGAAVNCDDPCRLKSTCCCAALGGVSTNRSHSRGNSFLRRSRGGTCPRSRGNCGFFSVAPIVVAGHFFSTLAGKRHLASFPNKVSHTSYTYFPNPTEC